VDVRDAAAELLDQGSPPGAGSGDPALLDEDSDNPSDIEHNNDIVTPMTLDTDSCETNDDPIYHQCKTACRTAFTDRLVSISGDGTFGSSVTSI
jgi:hypothetical protein